MVSDGVADPNRDDWLQNLLAGWGGDDPQTLPINLNAAMVSFKTNANTNSEVMERAMEARSGMPTDVTRHHDVIQQSM